MPFGLFTKKEEPLKTHFENCPEFKNLNKMINELRQEESYLNSAALNEGGSSIAYKKHALIFSILKRTEYNLKEFNDKKFGENDLDDKLAKYTVAIKITLDLLLVLSHDLNKTNLIDNLILLGTHRNYAKSVLYNSSHYGLIGGAIIATGPAGILSAIGIAIGSHIALRIGETIAGVNGTTRSLDIVNKLIGELSKLTDNLDYELNISMINRLQSAHDAIITEYKINHPDADFDAFKKAQLDSHDVARLVIGK